jgi:hypothetical protein
MLVFFTVLMLIAYSWVVGDCGLWIISAVGFGMAIWLFGAS